MHYHVEAAVHIYTDFHSKTGGSSAFTVNIRSSKGERTIHERLI